MIKPLVIAKSSNGTLGLITGSTILDYGTHRVTEWTGIVLETNKFKIEDNRPENIRTVFDVKDIIPQRILKTYNQLSDIITLEENSAISKEEDEVKEDGFLNVVQVKGDEWRSVDPTYIGEITAEQILEIMTTQKEKESKAS